MDSRIVFKQAFLLLSTAIILSACSSMYIPAISNTPLLEKQGEKQIELSVSTNSLNLSTAYALTNDLAIGLYGNLSYKNFTEYYDVFTYNQESYKESENFLFIGSEFAHKYAELSLGKFNILKSKRRLELFSGAGYGIATDKYYDKYQFNEKYLAGFVQVNYGISGRFYAAGGALRFSATAHDYRYQIDPSFAYPEANTG
jgi:hypothetical protein